MLPDSIMQNFSMSLMMVDLPEPLSPTKAMYSPLLMLRERLLRAIVFEVGYLKTTLRNQMSPVIVRLAPEDQSTRGLQSSISKTFWTAQVPLIIFVQLLEMEEVELARLVQYIMKEVSSPAVSSDLPQITIFPPYQRTIRIPRYGRNSLQELQMPVISNFFRLIRYPLQMASLYLSVSLISVEQALISCIPENFQATSAEIYACTS